MEAFDMAVCFNDELLDSGSDVGEKDEDEDEQINNFSKLNHNRSLPEFGEEELEWLSNKDAFPAVETSFVDILGATAKHQSPARSKRVRKCRDMRNQENRWWVKENVKNVRGGRVGRKCQHCLAEKTSQWRAGPHGPKTLCNACGIRYKSGRLVLEYHPASSPTFSDDLHSNSHRKILEMRRQKQLVFSAIKPMDKG
ncbi:Heat shock protein 60 isoform 1 [Hibiscus syriacus]|uniref:Heat shock protein 60 isoform 1 n=1 Tax=Hibiscus syriacus TaxID=106335 RepID=A0A6A3CCV6_HIBSY|nr:Heat shock protein 60 isoform 1 [Hibiscus syriacus]